MFFEFFEGSHSLINSVILNLEKTGSKVFEYFMILVVPSNNARARWQKRCSGLVLGRMKGCLTSNPL